MTLKQSQAYQTYNDNVDPKQGYHAQFERSWFNGIREKANIKVFFKRGIMSIISIEQAQKSRIVAYSRST